MMTVTDELILSNNEPREQTVLTLAKKITWEGKHMVDNRLTKKLLYQQQKLIHVESRCGQTIGFHLGNMQIANIFLALPESTIKG